MENVLEWLDERAQRTPDAVACADATNCCTFAELHGAVRSIARSVARQWAPGSIVAFYAEKSVDVLAGMLGAARAGCCYSVLDVRQPAARLHAMLDVLQPCAVVSDAAFYDHAAQMLDGTPYEVCDIASLRAGGQGDANADELLEQVKPGRGDALYVNFTSGSTGVPKGVAVSHGSVIDFISNFVDVFGITARDRIANQAPFDFDVSVKDIYGGLATGASVHLIPREYFSVPVQLMDYLCERQVTVCTWAVSAMCFVTTLGGFEYRTPDTVRLVVFSGEVMPPKHLRKWQAALPDATFANVYGPTEVTCNCTYWIVPAGFDGDVLPVGRPFAHAQVMLLDEQDVLVTEPGGQGQICVGGSGVALGYVHDPVRTSESFTVNPVDGTGRIYRTGDLGFWNEAGELMFLGRADHQIKHMGQRIELGEIEHVAQELAGVSRAICLYDDARKRIRLFYTGEVAKDDLVAFLKDKLPSYMVPNKTVQLDQMPLNKNGKVDRSALAQMR